MANDIKAVQPLSHDATRDEVLAKVNEIARKVSALILMPTNTDGARANPEPSPTPVEGARCFEPLPDAKYDVIYADPPWAYLWGGGKDGGRFAPERHYPTLSTDEICALPVKSIRATNCALLLWVTMPTLPDGLRVMKEWGFRYKTAAFVWVKTKKDGLPLSGMGSYTKANAEIVLLGMRGHIKAADKTVPQIVMHPRGRHSEKPAVVRERIERLFGDGERIELFARGSVPDGWSAWGNESANA